MKALNLTLALLALVSVFNVTPASAEKKGHKLFNLELADMNKKDVQINDYIHSSNYTVITFFAEYCSPCQRELDSINKKFAGWQLNHNTNFLAVCVSNNKDKNAIADKAQKHGWNFNIVIDDRNESVNMLRISHIPYTVVVDQNGYIVYQHEGYSEENLHNIENIIFSSQPASGGFVTK